MRQTMQRTHSSDRRSRGLLGSIKRYVVIAVGGVIVVVVAGCGGGSASSSAVMSTAASAVATAPSTEFMEKGGLNAPAEFGHVADQQERAAVSAVIAENFEDRSAGRWKAQCATYAAVMVE